MRKSVFLSFVALSVLAVAFSFDLSAAGKDKTYSGEIMDGACAKAGSHETMMKKAGLTSAKACALACVKMGNKYVLYDAASKTVYQLDDQTKPEQFAGDKVKVTGTYDRATQTIHVTDIRPAP